MAADGRATNFGIHYNFFVADFGKILVVVGVVIVVAGLVLMLGGRLHLPIGRLPGDIVYRGQEYNGISPHHDLHSCEHPPLAGAVPDLSIQPVKAL
jgi:hypothetical protein